MSHIDEADGIPAVKAAVKDTTADKNSGLLFGF
jgi:hypothetical protein